MNRQPSRREFLRSSAAAGAALPAMAVPRSGVFAGSGPLRVLSVGVVGTIGRKDRREIGRHKDAEIVGLCDVDSNALQKAAQEEPNAFTCRDYRQAFAEHADEFDAVIVSTPDHSHAPIMLMAMAHDKHVYGQKPLVQQLEELVLMDRALAAKPHLVTQLGNQRMVYPGRRAAVDILRDGMLGKAIEAYAWTGSPNRGRYFNYDRKLNEPSDPPEHIDWDLWLGPCEEAPFRPGLAPIVWRSWWEYGTNGLGDWGCHVLDVIFFAYDELDSPHAVLTHSHDAADEHFHPHPCRSTITYSVHSKKFKHRHFPIHYSDCAQKPSRAALGLPADAYLENNCAVVVCEGGTLVIGAGGRLDIWRDRMMTKGLRLPGIVDRHYPKLNHWHAWVDHCCGRTEGELRTPFQDAVRITEPALLAVKAARYPGVELRWDKARRAFTNHEEASKTLVRRKYRKGFAPPRVG